MSYAIKRNDVAGDLYFTFKVGRDFGSPLGGWTTEAQKALQFAREHDAQSMLDVVLPYNAPFCDVVEL